MQTLQPDLSRFWDAKAAGYDAAYDSAGPGGHVLRARLAAAMGALGPGPGRLLDAGAAGGRLLERAAGLGWEVTGVDLSPAMVAIAGRRVPRAELATSRIEELPYADGAFDAVAALGVLEYAKPVDDALRELARVLRPGGRAVISYPIRHSAYGRSRRALVNRGWHAVERRLRPRAPVRSTLRGALPTDDFARRVAAAGFTVEAMTPCSVLVVPWPLERVVPRAAQRLGERLEPRAPRLPLWAATQSVWSLRC